MLTLTNKKLPVALVCLTMTAVPALACTTYDDAMNSVRAQDRTEAARLYEMMADLDDCGPTRDWVGIYLAREYFRDSTDPALSPEEQRESLEASLALEVHWRTLSALGQLAWNDADYGEAASRLAEALTQIAEGDQSHEASPDEIIAVRDLYTDALALSGELMASADPELFRDNYRGFIVEETPLPITFEFDSASFDEQGLIYADALLDHVLSYNPPRIELDGHTDPQGGEDYNYTLSVDRAEAVRDHLIAGGYQGEIVIRGFGESQLPDAPEGVAEGSEEHFRIARRVTFRTG